MEKKIELPFSEPLVSALHCYIPPGMCLYENPSLINWYLNEVIDFRCDKAFLSGVTTPLFYIEEAFFGNCPYLETHMYPMRFAKGNINSIIREFLRNGYYVFFSGVDDYYLENKSFYHERHFYHDGIIYGYDQEKKTYSIYAYDKNWVCRKFEISQKSFNKGREAMFSQKKYGDVCGFKPQNQQILFDLKVALDGIVRYMDSSFEKYPINSRGLAHGIIVQDFLAMYLEKLLDGSIPFERMDRRIMRPIWEHKRLMKMRIEKIEEHLKLNSDISKDYESVEKEANALRILYATYNRKKRDSLLLNIHDRLLKLKEKEYRLLQQLIDKAKEALEQ